MHPFNGKRDKRERIPGQVNLDARLSEYIRESAARNLRPVGSEIHRLLTVGVEHDPDANIHAHFRLFAHVMAPQRTTTPAGAQERKRA